MKQITTGFELEAVALTPSAGAIVNDEGFGLRHDASVLSLTGQPLPQKGREIVTPIYTVNAQVSYGGVADIQSGRVPIALRQMSQCVGPVNSSCGLHVHLGKPSKEPTTWNPARLPNVVGGQLSKWEPSEVRTWLLIGLMLEDRLFSVVPDSRKQSRHCRPIRQVYPEEDLTSYHPVGETVPRKYDNQKRYCWLNLIETKRQGSPEEERVGYASSKAYGTVEVRMLGETKRPDYMITWANLWLKIAMAIAYLPSDMAVLHCAYSNWLQPDFDRLSQLKQSHVRLDQPQNLIPSWPNCGNHAINLGE